jgi:hypothetical protein
MSKWTKVLLVCIGWLFAVNNSAFSQGCAMCTATASNLDGKAAEGLNLGILYLAVIPITLMSVLFYKWYKSNKNTQETE